MASTSESSSTDDVVFPHLALIVHLHAVCPHLRNTNSHIGSRAPSTAVERVYTDVLRTEYRTPKVRATVYGIFYLGGSSVCPYPYSVASSCIAIRDWVAEGRCE